MLSEKVSILPEFRHSPAYLRSEQATQSRPCGWNGNGGGISTGGVGAGGEERGERRQRGAWEAWPPRAAQTWVP